MPFKNFSIWHGRLPHWRADDVTYFVTFKHRRSIDSEERLVLLRELIKPQGRMWVLFIACVLPDKTDLIFKVLDSTNGSPYELSRIVERAKTKAGKLIAKQVGERFPPFYAESFDRIIRDVAELEALWHQIVESPRVEGLCETTDDYAGLWLATPET